MNYTFFTLLIFLLISLYRLDGVAKEIEDAQNDIIDIDGRVTETDADVMDMVGMLNINQMIAEALKQETEEHEERLNNMEDVMEEVVENVEEIDKKVIMLI